MAKIPRIMTKIFNLTQKHRSHRELPQGLGWG